jgi:hypothetical protein
VDEGDVTGLVSEDGEEKSRRLKGGLMTRLLYD